MLPSVFGDSFFEDLMSFPFERAMKPMVSNTGLRGYLMKTDIKETDTDYELTVDLPGYKKEDISIKLDKGYLQINATQNVENDEKDEEGKYIRRERVTGNMSRSFYVGDDIAQDDIHASFADGILKLAVPKQPKPEVEAQKYIAIE